MSRINLVANLQINKFSGAGITDYDRGMTNAIAVKKGDKLVAQQRPSIDIFEDASTIISDARGRAIFYWSGNTALYILNADTVYKGSQSTSVGTVTTGTKKCKFLVNGNDLVLLDPQNGEGWYITTGDVLTQITDGNFPSTLAYGGAVLNNVLYVMDTSANIYNASNSDDPTVWSATGFINASRQPDGGSYLGLHHDNLVAMGPRTIEMFYDAGNVTGSPLSRRQDVAFTVGCNDGESVWQDGDKIYFIGVNSSGGLGVYKIEQLQLKKLSDDNFDDFLTEAIIKNSYTLVGSGITGGGHTFYLMTFCTTPSDVSPALTVAYDTNTGLFHIFDVSIVGLSAMPVIDWTVREGVSPRSGEGILVTGDLMTMNDNLVPQDTLQGSTYVTTGYVVTDYVSDTSDQGTAIAVTLRSGQEDFKTDSVKFCGEIGLNCDQSASTQTVTVKWSNSDNQSFTSGKTIDTSKERRRIRRCGKFQRRNHQVSHSSTEILQLESLSADIEAGTG